MSSAPKTCTLDQMEQSFLFTHRNDLYLLTKDNRYYSRDNSYKGVHGGSIAHLPSLSVFAGCSGCT
ncbi:hypothetical protein EMIT0P74_100283 [Pseudomonas sp. IT-P74]